MKKNKLDLKVTIYHFYLLFTIIHLTRSFKTTFHLLIQKIDINNSSTLSPNTN